MTEIPGHDGLSILDVFATLPTGEDPDGIYRDSFTIIAVMLSLRVEPVPHDECASNYSPTELQDMANLVVDAFSRHDDADWLELIGSASLLRSAITFFAADGIMRPYFPAETVSGLLLLAARS